MTKWWLIALGGGIGSVLRYALHGWVQRQSGSSFPVGTMVVNVLGCLLLGVAAGYFAGTTGVREEYRLGLAVGLLGGFTTFSTFGLETFQLASGGELRLAALNMLLSCGAGLAAVWAGYRLAERMAGA